MNKNAFISEHGKLSNGILLNVAEILAIRLPEGDERITASKWVKKFLACNPEAYKNALSLFISTLTKQVLVEPFDKPPSEPRDQWQGFRREYTSSDINEAVKARLYKDALTPPYKIEISHDLTEYLAYQEIPFFGAHFYYAFSPSETIEKWQNFRKLQIPQKYVEVLKLPHVLESPVKGGFGSHPKDRIRRSPKVVASKTRLAQKKKPASKKPKDDWQGPIEEEVKEPEPEPVKRNMIVIPTDGPTKAIPEALQRRMLEAERQKAERLSLKEQEKTVRSKKITPAIAGQKKKLKVPRKSMEGTLQAGTSKKLQEEILRESSAAEAAALKESDVETDEESKQPLSFKERYAALKASTLADLPAEFEKASAALAEGIRRAQEEGIADSAFVDKIQQREIEIANQLKDMLEKYDNQVDVVTEKIQIIEDDFEALSFSAKKINVDFKKTVVAPETLDKIQELLTEVKEIQPKIAESQSRKTALFTLPDEQIVALSEKPEVAGNAEKLLTLMGNVVAQAQTAVKDLNKIDPKSESEQNFIANSIDSNQSLIGEIGKIIGNLIQSIEQKDPKLEALSLQMAAILQQTIEMFKQIDLEFARNLQPTAAILNAVDIQTDKAAMLGTIHGEAGDIIQDIEARNVEKTLHKTLLEMNHEPQHLDLRRQLGLENEVEDEVLHITDKDIEFEGGVFDDEEFLSASRAQKRRDEQRQMQITKLFNNIADEETLNDVTANFDDLLDSVEKIVEDLDVAQANPLFSEEQQQQIAQVKDQAEEVKETLEKSREEVENALSEAAQANEQGSFHLSQLTDQDYEELFGP